MSSLVPSTLRSGALPALVAALVLLVVAGCDKTPTGRWQLALVPEDYLARMGAQSFTELKRARPLETSPRPNTLVDCVARAIIEVSPARERSWEVAVFRDPRPNAFALPGRKIGVNTGILRVAETPGQLATIVGHEVAHLLADHGNERMTQQLGVKVLLVAVGLFGGESEGAEGELVRKVLGLGAQVGVLLPFSRAHEEEADVLGLRLMARAGFDPRESLEFWRNMSRLDAEQPPELLSTHPSHGSRIETLRAEMDRTLELWRSALETRGRSECGAP